MRVGIDIDATIVNTRHMMERDIIHKLLDEGLPFVYSNKDYDFKSCLGNMYDDLVQSYLSNEFEKRINTEAGFIKNAVEVINLIHNAGHEICIMTARHAGKDKWVKYEGVIPIEDDAYLEETRQLLIHAGIPVSMFIVSDDKCAACKDLDISVLVDDHPRHIGECYVSGIYTVCSRQSYNMDTLCHESFNGDWAELITNQSKLLRPID